MSLKKKITLFIGLLIMVVVIIISSISIYSIYNKGQRDIEKFREDQMAQARDGLKDIVDVGYGLLEAGYNASNGEDMESTLTLLSKLRFDNGEGYFWITTDELPYPTMVMHAAKPKNNGKVMSDPKYNVVKGKENKNLYQERVEQVRMNNEAFVEYFMVKPGDEKVYDKLSFSKVFKPLGWVISSGIYTDSIQEAVDRQADDIENQIKFIFLIILISSIIIVVASIYLAIRFSDIVISTIINVRNKLRDLAQGKVIERIEKTSNDELGDMTDSLNDLVVGITQYSNFAREIGNGQLDASFDTLSDEDVLGGELVKMRDSLAANRAENKVRNWTTEGIAKFADILRSDSDLKSLSQKIIINYVKYFNANQGSLFLLIDDENQEPYLELAATYAYDRVKYLEKNIDLGQGLAGQCVLEGKTIHLRELPKSFVNITSGLGTAPPNSILIVPLKFNDQIFGVIEMASFNLFEDHEITLAEKLGEDIASTISNVRTSERTRILLEESKEMSSNMQAQEEMLRQNQEELQATQEQMRRRQEELEAENETLKAEISKLAGAGNSQ